MKNNRHYQSYFLFIVIILMAGQLVFASLAKSYTTPSFESKIFFTTGIVFDGSDLHKLNEGAHYFGQTMIGWTKFPNFKKELIQSVQLPENAEINMHVQERQNMIFNIFTKEEIEFDQLKKTKDYLQSKIKQYNENTNTQFVMSNVDYQQLKIAKNYSFGAMMTLVLSLAVAMALIFIREMFFPPKLKF